MVDKNRSAAHITLYNAPENINTNILAKENALKHSTAKLLLKLMGMKSFTFKDKSHARFGQVFEGCIELIVINLGRKVKGPGKGAVAYGPLVPGFVLLEGFNHQVLVDKLKTMHLSFTHTQKPNLPELCTLINRLTNNLKFFQWSGYTHYSKHKNTGGRPARLTGPRSGVTIPAIEYAEFSNTLRRVSSTHSSTPMTSTSLERMKRRTPNGTPTAGSRLLH